ncbi:MAG: beta-hydroxyacyl-ACP dehydratase [Alphaproteobacteria bacterium]|nr:beta-hydroxyacyl-ACP dehydratase [Alphaproteobacteria bacterium]
MRWLLVDRIDEMVVGQSARGAKAFTLSEPFFADHFPGFPVVPGVLLLESMAQLSGKLIGYTVRLERGDWPFPIFTMADRVKFRRFVRPGEVVELHTSFIALREESAAMKVRAKVGGKVVAQAEETFVFNAVPLDDPAERVRVEALERRALRQLWAGLPPEHA